MSFLTVKLFGFFLYASAGAVAASTSASTGASTLAAETAVAATPGGLRFSHPRVFPTTGPVCDGLRPSFFHFYPKFPGVIPSFAMFFSIPVTKEKHGETPERAPRECHGKCPEVRNEREAPGVVGQGRSCG